MYMYSVRMHNVTANTDKVVHSYSSNYNND